MKVIESEVRGVTPLLMNRFPGLGQFDEKVKIVNPNIDGVQDAVKKLYSINGTIYQPASHIRGTLINAGKDLRIKGKGKATYSKTLASMVVVEPEAIPHKFKEWTVFPACTVNPSTKGRIVTYRPKFDKWELEFRLIIDDEVPIEVVKEALERAGRYVGIGDWRPATKGMYGKFMVTKFDVVEPE